MASFHLAQSIQISGSRLAGRQPLQFPFASQALTLRLLQAPGQDVCRQRAWEFREAARRLWGRIRAIHETLRPWGTPAPITAGFGIPEDPVQPIEDLLEAGRTTDADAAIEQLMARKLNSEEWCRLILTMQRTLLAMDASAEFRIARYRKIIPGIEALRDREEQSKNKYAGRLTLAQAFCYLAEALLQSHNPGEALDSIRRARTELDFPKPKEKALELDRKNKRDWKWLERNQTRCALHFIMAELKADQFDESSDPEALSTAIAEAEAGADLFTTFEVFLAYKAKKLCTLVGMLANRLDHEIAENQIAITNQEIDLWLERAERATKELAATETSGDPAMRETIRANLAYFAQVHAYARMKQHRWTLALPILEEASRDPDQSIFIPEMLAATYLHLGHLEKAVKWAEEAQSAFSQGVIERGDIMLANAQESAGVNSASAKSFYRKALDAWQSLENTESWEKLRHGRLLPGILQGMAEAHLGLSDVEKAIPCVRDLLEVTREPDNAMVLRLAGQAQQAGVFQEFVEALERSENSPWGTGLAGKMRMVPPESRILRRRIFSEQDMSEELKRLLLGLPGKKPEVILAEVHALFDPNLTFVNSHHLQTLLLCANEVLQEARADPDRRQVFLEWIRGLAEERHLAKQPDAAIVMTEASRLLRHLHDEQSSVLAEAYRQPANELTSLEQAALSYLTDQEKGKAAQLRVRALRNPEGSPYHAVEIRFSPEVRQAALRTKSDLLMRAQALMNHIRAVEFERAKEKAKYSYAALAETLRLVSPQIEANLLISGRTRLAGFRMDLSKVDQEARRRGVTKMDDVQSMRARLLARIDRLDNQIRKEEDRMIAVVFGATLALDQLCTQAFQSIASQAADIVSLDSLTLFGSLRSELAEAAKLDSSARAGIQKVRKASWNIPAVSEWAMTAADASRRQAEESLRQTEIRLQEALRKPWLDLAARIERCVQAEELPGLRAERDELEKISRQHPTWTDGLRPLRNRVDQALRKAPDMIAGAGNIRQAVELFGEVSRTCLTIQAALATMTVPQDRPALNEQAAELERMKQKMTGANRLLGSVDQAGPLIGLRFTAVSRARSTQTNALDRARKALELATTKVEAAEQQELAQLVQAWNKLADQAEHLKWTQAYTLELLEKAGQELASSEASIRRGTEPALMAARSRFDQTMGGVAEAEQTDIRVWAISEAEASYIAGLAAFGFDLTQLPDHLALNRFGQSVVNAVQSAVDQGTSHALIYVALHWLESYRDDYRTLMKIAWDSPSAPDEDRLLATALATKLKEAS